MVPSLHEYLQDVGRSPRPSECLAACFHHAATRSHRKSLRWPFFYRGVRRSLAGCYAFASSTERRLDSIRRRGHPTGIVSAVRKVGKRSSFKLPTPSDTPVDKQAEH